MSNRRSIVYLMFLLAIAIGVNLWLDISGNDHGEVMRRRALVRNADTAVAVEIFAANGSGIRLERTDLWRIAMPFRAAADQAAVERLTDNLAFGPLVDSVDEAAALRLGKTAEDFGLANPRLTLRVTSDRAEHTTVFFGSEVPSGEGVYASVDGSSVIYIVSTEVFRCADLSVDSWRRRNVFQVTPEEVSSIDIRRNGSLTRISRRGERWEVIEPRRAMASTAAVKRIVDTVLSCEARKFVWPVGASNETVTASVALLAGYGLDPESCETVVFRTGDGRDHSISFGGAADNESVYALVHGGTAVAMVAAEAKTSVCLDAESLVDGRLFPVDKSAVQSVMLVDGDTAYLLARGDNGRWRLDAPVSAAADESAVATLIDKLLVMRNGDLDENGIKVAVRSNAVPVSVSRKTLLGEAGFEQLRSRVILDFDAATIRRLVVAPTGAEKPESVIFDPERKGWNIDPTGRAGIIDIDRLDAVLAVLCPLKAKSVARLKVSPDELARYGLETPTCAIAVDRLLEGSVRRNILLGGPANAEGDAYATVGSSDAVFILDGETVRTLISGVFKE